MNIHDLREAQARYEAKIEHIEKSRKKMHSQRISFVNFFNEKKIRSMEIDEFVSGTTLPKERPNFCNTLERQLDGLGKIIGSTAFKFGVYYGQRKSDSVIKYRHTKKFGDNHLQAFENVRNEILSLLEAGKSQDIKKIVSNKLSTMFKGKILSSYYPERYLNVFSDEHLDFFLIQLDIDSKELIKRNPVIKREALLEFKNQDPIMVNWSVDLFGNFLYTEYPGRPPKRKENRNDILADYRTPLFPTNQKAEFIELDLDFLDISKNSNKSNEKKRVKIDYEQENRRLRKLGDRGEKLVFDEEVRFLKGNGRTDLAEKVQRVSLISDSYGYDILSFELDGTPKYIEVKTTTSKIGRTSFYISSNELEVSKSIENYYFYIVFEVKSAFPKIWKVKDMFQPKYRDKMLIEPVNYKVLIKTIEL